MNIRIQQLLRDSEEKLRSAELPPEDAAILIAQILGIEKAELYSHPERELSSEDYIRVETSLQKRLAGYAVASIIGHKEFFGLDFIVSEDTLIPRPETELLVEKALDYLKANDHQTILDMGTGSGCIIISIAKNIPSNRHNLCYGTDISEKALSVARENAKRHDAQIHFSRSNLFEQLGSQRYTMLIANLPYLTTSQLQEPSIAREPVGALWGGTDGLDLYRAFLQQARDHVAEKWCMLLEIDPAQFQEIRTIAQEYFPEALCTISKDLAGRDRLVTITS